MPAKRGNNGRLTAYAGLEARQRAFVRHTVNGKDPEEAAALAKYVDPVSAAGELMENTAVQAAIQEQLRNLCSMISGLALKKLMAMLQKDLIKEPAEIMRVARLVMDKALPNAETAKPDDNSDSMSLDDMQAALDRIKSARADASKPVIDADSIPDVESPHPDIEPA
jgi:hypothetical protein